MEDHDSSNIANSLGGEQTKAIIYDGCGGCDGVCVGMKSKLQDFLLNRIAL